MAGLIERCLKPKKAKRLLCRRFAFLGFKFYKGGALRRLYF
jgi:hypothetical protein